MFIEINPATQGAAIKLAQHGVVEIKRQLNPLSGFFLLPHFINPEKSEVYIKADKDSDEGFNCLVSELPQGVKDTIIMKWDGISSQDANELAGRVKGIYYS